MMWSMIGSSARILLLVIPPFSTFSSEKMIEIVVETNTWFQKTALTLKMWKRLLYKRTCSHRGREYCILPQTALVVCSTCFSVMNGQSKKLKVPTWSIFRVAHHVHPACSAGSPSWWRTFWRFPWMWSWWHWSWSTWSFWDETRCPKMARFLVRWDWTMTKPMQNWPLECSFGDTFYIVVSGWVYHQPHENMYTSEHQW